MTTEQKLYPIERVLTDADHLANTADQLLLALGKLACAEADDDSEFLAETVEQYQSEVTDWTRAIVSATHEYRKRAQRFRDSLAESTADELAPGYPRVDVGLGKFAIGAGVCRVSNNPALMFLHLDEPREVGANCADVYPVGVEAPKDRIAAAIHFHNASAVQQVIDELLSIQREHYPAAEQAQQAAPVARDVIAKLVELTRAVNIALDDSEERDGIDGREHVIDSVNFDAVCDALEALEELPDNKPGWAMNAADKAEWALRHLTAAQPRAVAVAVPDEMESVHDTPFMSADTEPEIAYRDGWNACRAAMLAAAPQAVSEGCGACGDGCKGQGCRLERESPPFVPQPVAHPCWSCGRLVTAERRAAADGDCPNCGAELDLEDWPAAAQKGGA